MIYWSEYAVCIILFKDKCEVNNGGCGLNAICSHDPQTFEVICACKPGFTNPGTTAQIVCKGRQSEFSRKRIRQTWILRFTIHRELSSEQRRMWCQCSVFVQSKNECSYLYLQGRLRQHRHKHQCGLHSNVRSLRLKSHSSTRKHQQPDFHQRQLPLVSGWLPLWLAFYYTRYIIAFLHNQVWLQESWHYNKDDPNTEHTALLCAHTDGWHSDQCIGCGRWCSEVVFSGSCVWSGILIHSTYSALYLCMRAFQWISTTFIPYGGGRREILFYLLLGRAFTRICEWVSES